MGQASQRHPELPPLHARMQSSIDVTQDQDVIVLTLSLLSAKLDQPGLPLGSRAVLQFDGVERRGTVMWSNKQASVVAFDQPLRPRDLIKARARFDCCPVRAAAQKWMLSRR